jgi:hypothetical protein
MWEFLSMSFFFLSPNVTWLLMSMMYYWLLPYQTTGPTVESSLIRLVANLTLMGAYYGFFYFSLYVKDWGKRKFTPGSFPLPINMAHNVYYWALGVIQWTAYEVSGGARRGAASEAKRSEVSERSERAIERSDRAKRSSEAIERSDRAKRLSEVIERSD